MNCPVRFSILLAAFLFYGQAMLAQEASTDAFIPKLMPAIGHTSGVISAHYSPDGKHILTSSYDGTVKIWDAGSGKLLVDLMGHTNQITSAHYSPDGKHILTSSWDGTAKIWDVRTGTLRVDLKGHTGPVVSAHYSRDGKHILTVSRDSTVKIWDASTGTLRVDLKGHTGPVVSAHYSGDGEHILTAGRDSTVKIWDARSGTLLVALVAHTSALTSAQYSPDGKYVLVVGDDKTAKIWDAGSGKLSAVLKGHTDKLSTAQYSPDGKHILTGSEDQTAKIWDAGSGKLLVDLKGHAGAVSSIQYSPDKKHILTTSSDGTAKIWAAGSGKLLIELKGHTEQVSSAQYSPDGKHILTASWDKTAKIWEANSGKLLVDLTGHTGWINSAQYSPNGKRILATMIYDGTAKIWDAGNGKVLVSLSGLSRQITSAQYSPNGRQILTASGDGTPQIWDANSGKVMVDLIGHTGQVWSAQYSPDGKHVLTTSFDKTAKIWDANSGKVLVDLTGHTGRVWSAQFSPDGQHILTASGDSTAKIWDAGNGKALVSLNGHTKEVLSAQYSPDGKQILTVSWDHTAKIWDAGSGQLVVDSIGYPITSAQYSPDGKRILSDGGRLKIWDAGSGKLLVDFKGETGFVSSAQYSPDGQYILTVRGDKTAKIWDANSGKAIVDLKGHTNEVLSAQYSPDGKHILTASMDGSMKFWRFPSGELLLTLFPLGSKDWVVIHPSGLFDASPKAMEWMYYLVGLEVIELEQLKERYYEPGLFQRIMANDGRALRDVKKFNAVEMYPEMQASIENDTLRIGLKERNGGIGKISLFVNNKEVLRDANANRDTSISIDLKAFARFYLQDTINRIGIRTYNAEGWLKSSPYTLEYLPEFVKKKGQEGARPLSPLKAYHPNYFAVVIGTSDYSGEQLDLRYADKDASDMASALRQTADPLFGAEQVHLEWFSTDTRSGAKLASKENIRAAFESFEKMAKAEDMLIIFFSGHGTTFGGAENEQFYYLTRDCYSGDLSDPAIRSNYAISSEELTQWIAAIPAQKQVMILDACSSGKVTEDLLAVRNIPPSQIRALDRMKDRTGMFVLAGSAADMVSYEASQFGQGLLTYSLLLGMSGGALREDRTVDVMQLFQFARDKVPEFARDIGGIQTPTLAFPRDGSSFPMGLVTAEVVIPLQDQKPVFIRSNFQEEEDFQDVIGLSEALDDYLVNSAADMTSRGIVFVDVKRHEGAYAINGLYTLDGNRVLLRGGVFKGKEKKGGFELTGDSNEVEQLVEAILEEVNRVLRTR